jgi:hypothetical protein
MIQRLSYVTVWKSKDGEWKARLADFKDDQKKEHAC